MITKWQDFGKGKHPEDPIYRSHVDTKLYSLHPWAEPSSLKEEEFNGWQQGPKTDPFHYNKLPERPISLILTPWENYFSSDVRAIRDTYERSKPFQSVAQKKYRGLIRSSKSKTIEESYFKDVGVVFLDQ